MKTILTAYEFVSLSTSLRLDGGFLNLLQVSLVTGLFILQNNAVV